MHERASLHRVERTRFGVGEKVGEYEDRKKVKT